MAERPTSVVDATTTVAAVIGQPVAHSLSPVIMNAAFGSLRAPWIFVAFEVAQGEAAAALAAMRALGLGGLSVTMPHKREMAQAVDRLTESAKLLESVNCVYRDGTELVGDSTDGRGLVAAVRAVDPGRPLAGRQVAVIGAGGAARSIVHALAEAGAGSISVVNRTAERAEAAAALAPAVTRHAPPEAVRDADLVINATPVGMGTDAGTPCDPQLIRADAVVIDTVYHPIETPLLAACRARSIACANGVGMLVHQAAAQVEHWLGRAPAIDVMHAAAARKLGE